MKKQTIQEWALINQKWVNKKYKELVKGNKMVVDLEVFLPDFTDDEYRTDQYTIFVNDYGELKIKL